MCGVQKYRQLFCENTERCSAKILKGALQNCWWRVLTQNEQLPCKNSGTFKTSLSCYIMAFFFRRRNDNKKLLRANSLANF